jgi:hypothetical protein
MFKYVMSLLVCASVMASPVLAGGGGAKKDANIRFVNNLTTVQLPPATFGNTSIIVIANPSVALVAKVNGGTATPKDITAEGGVIIKQGRSATLPVKSGNVPGRVAVVLKNGLVRGVAAGNVAVAKGATVTINATAAVPANPPAVAW